MSSNNDSVRPNEHKHKTKNLLNGLSTVPNPQGSTANAIKDYNCRLYVQNETQGNKS